MTVDALGNLARFTLLPGQRHDTVEAAPILEGLDFDALLADKAFDTNAIRADLAERGVIALVPSKADRKEPILHDIGMYKWRHLVETFFRRIKGLRRIATCYDKTDTSSAAAMRLVGIALAAR